MDIAYTAHFKRNLQKVPDVIKTKFKKQVSFLLGNMHHPSLRVKKYEETTGTWQARIDHNYRFYFVIRGTRYILIEIRKHPK